MITVGVDLSAAAKGTAVATVGWSPEGAVVTDLVSGADDESIVRAVSGADKAGIDCPLGWPVPFVEFVSRHHDGHVVVPDGVSGRDWRRTLVFRTTDVAVRAQTGRFPLSVSADLIGHVAMRCAGLLAQLAIEGRTVDRAGSGVVVEVYPAASLKQWGLPHRGYKGAARAVLLGAAVDALLAAAPWLKLGEFEAACRRSDDAFDALVAALTARAAQLRQVTVPRGEQVALAAIEGWIALPTRGLDAMGPGGSASG